MKLDDDAKVYLFWDAELSFDPTGSTVQLEVDATLYPMTWQGSAVQSGATWKQTARTDQLFRGTAASTGGSPVALTAGRHWAQPLVSSGSQVVASPSTPLDIR